MTECLNANAIGLTAVGANKVLHASGMIENRWRESSKPGRPMKCYRAATTLGEQHGAINERNTIGTCDPINLKYQSSAFLSLWSHPSVQTTLDALLTSGEVRMRESAQGHATEIF